MDSKGFDAAGKSGRSLKIPMSVKLTTIVTLILMASVWIIITLMSMMVNAEFTRISGETSYTINRRTAAGVEERLNQIRSEGLLLLEMSMEAGSGGSLAARLRSVFFERNPYIAAIIVPGTEDAFNFPFFSRNEISPETVDAWLMREAEAIERASAGEPILRNATPAFGIHLLALFYPWQNSGAEEAAVIFFSPQSLLEITGAGAGVTVVVNGEGDILIAPDFNLVLGGESMSAHPLFESLWKSDGESVLLNYTEGGNRYAGAGHRTPLANAAVFTFLEYSIIAGQLDAVKQRNILLSAAIMFFTILAAWLYSGTITAQMKRLMAAMAQIESGDFKPDIKIRAGDELGDLSGRLLAMGDGLNRLKDSSDLVGRYNNRQITDKVLAGEIKLEGEYIRAVTLSMDLVSFYSLSEDAGKISPGELLHHLNFLISKIADSVEKNCGVVDKISGANLLAVWGIPYPSEAITGEVMNCLRSAVAVRSFLWELNTEQENRGRPPYKIHCGIHTGEVLAGRIGSSGSYQYTTVGKTIDETVKAMDACHRVRTDIIITEAVRELAGDRIVAEQLDLPRFRKGDFPIYGLVNLAPVQGQEPRWPFTLSDVQESLRERKS